MEPKKTFYVAALAASAPGISGLIKHMEGVGYGQLDVAGTQEGIHKPYLDDPQGNAGYCKRLIDAVLDADVVILFDYDAAGMRQAYMEFFGVVCIHTALGGDNATNPLVTLFDGTPDEFLAKLPNLLA
jgi:hypothetical protein